MGISISLLRLFPSHISDILKNVTSTCGFKVEEVRIKLGQALIVRGCQTEFICKEVIATRGDITHILMNATNGAFHNAIDKIQNGYLPLGDGCRLGICGEGTLQNGVLYNLKNINALCLRVARPIIGCADDVFSIISKDHLKNTIIIAPPGVGKTTLLREIIRKSSESGYYVGVVDEREEISGMYMGVPSFDLGPRTDVITGVSKEIAAPMLIRSMSPDLITMDEITSVKDCPAIIEAYGKGVTLITTVHGENRFDLYKPSILPIMDLKIFHYAIYIEIRNNRRNYIVENLNE